jgi:hypothetical protein
MVSSSRSHIPISMRNLYFYSDNNLFPTPSETAAVPRSGTLSQENYKNGRFQGTKTYSSMFI